MTISDECAIAALVVGFLGMQYAIWFLAEWIEKEATSYIRRLRP